MQSKPKGTNNIIQIFVHLNKVKKMKTALQVDITYDQIIALVRQMPKNEKIRLTKELEKEGIESRLSGLLKTFSTKKLSLKTINEEVEIVRQQIYESQKH